MPCRLLLTPHPTETPRPSLPPHSEHQDSETSGLTKRSLSNPSLPTPFSLMIRLLISEKRQSDEKFLPLSSSALPIYLQPELCLPELKVTVPPQHLDSRLLRKVRSSVHPPPLHQRPLSLGSFPLVSLLWKAFLDPRVPWPPYHFLSCFTDTL